MSPLISGYEYRIQDTATSYTPIDSAYAQRGVEEDWLVLIDSYRDYLDRYVYVYALVE